MEERELRGVEVLERGDGFVVVKKEVSPGVHAVTLVPIFPYQKKDVSKPEALQR